MSMEELITLTINGSNETASFPPHRTLLEALRELGHIEVKCGCEKGDCGACAVLVDGVAVDSCLALAWTAQGRAITTIAGLASTHPLLRAFVDVGAAQCGYCTPGMVMAAKSMLDRNPDPTEEDIRIGLSGNLCRCTGYVKIVEAVTVAAAAMRSQGSQK